MPTPLTDRPCVAIRDTATAPFKRFNLVMYGGYSVFYFYCPLLLKRRGLSSTLVGSVLALRPVVGTLVTPLWSTMADYLGSHRVLHAFGLLVGSSSRALYLLMPTEPALLVMGAVLSESLTCHIVPLTDAATFLGLERLGRSKDEYALQRLWGAVSAGWIFVPLAGILLSFSTSQATDWTIVLGMHVGLLSVCACFTRELWAVGRPRTVDVRPDAVRPRGAATGGMRTTLQRLRQQLRFQWSVFGRCAIFFACGGFHAVTEGYIFLYLEQLGASELLDGLAITSTCLAEVAVMALAPGLVARFGVDGCLLLVLGAYLVRFTGYACLPLLMPHTWLILPIQLLHGLTFGLYWTVGVSYAASCAPAGLEATVQGGFTALISAGQTVALLIGGCLFDAIGGARLYQRAALAAGAVGLFAAVLTFCGPTTDLTGSARAQVATERPAMVDEPAGIPPAMLEATGGEAPGSIGEQAAAGADEVPAQASKMSETAATLLGTGMLRSDAASQGKGIANSSIQSYHGKARDVQNNVQM